MTDRYAVFGNPVAHSKSPLIHSLFAKQTKQDITYDKKEIPLDGFAEAVNKFFEEGGKGLNITVPFKLDAFSFAEKNGSVSERAKNAGAVNTLKIMPDGKICGDNTDGCGLVCDITQNLGWKITGKNILILGAGGAVQGVLSKIIDAGASDIIIANRTEAKAIALAKKFKRMKSQATIKGCAYHEIEKSPVDLIINGTSASLSDNLPPLPDELVRVSTVCYDMMYSKKDTVFMQWAKQCGSEYVFDGLGMLVEQAAESFYLWRGVRPETAPVIKEVRQQL